MPKRSASKPPKPARKIPTEKGKSNLTPTFPDRPIGYGNPPMETQIKPGEVRNAGGRPKLLSNAYKKMLAEVNPRDPEGRTNAELIAVAARTEALKGDVSAMREIRSATEGDKSTALTIDLTKLTDEQLLRIANGEDPAIVAATPSGSDAGNSAADSGGGQ